RFFKNQTKAAEEHRRGVTSASLEEVYHTSLCSLNGQQARELTRVRNGKERKGLKGGFARDPLNNDAASSCRVRCLIRTLSFEEVFGRRVPCATVPAWRCAQPPSPRGRRRYVRI
ncbi:unnamed protein product, partial [Scytosiphon promiscuus]